MDIFEKKYKAVLKTATQWIKDGCTDKEKICLECVFPELRESEDERIRKGIIEIIKAVSGPDCDVYLDEKKQEKYLAWLEKQKEQKPAWSEEDEKMLADTIFKLAGFMGNEKNIAWLKSLRPKPKQEWSEEDEKNLGQVISGRYLPLGLREWFCGLPERFSSRPSWKPSEEQMEALENSTALTEEQGAALYSLVHDLKKL